MKKRNFVRKAALFLLALAPVAANSQWFSAFWLGEEELPDVIEY